MPTVWLHPITEKQLRVLQDEWGVDGSNPSLGWYEVLQPQASKLLACGDRGSAKVCSLVSRGYRRLLHPCILLFARSKPVLDPPCPASAVDLALWLLQGAMLDWTEIVAIIQDRLRAVSTEPPSLSLPSRRLKRLVERCSCHAQRVGSELGTQSDSGTMALTSGCVQAGLRFQCVTESNSVACANKFEFRPRQFDRAARPQDGHLRQEQAGN